MKNFVKRQISCNFATKLKHIKRLRHIFAVLAWTIVTIYVTFVVLLNIPTVQRFVASEVAEALSAKLGTKVELGKVNVGLLNRAIIDDVLIQDQQHHDMMRCHRLSAKIDILPLFNGRISISSAQIFGLTGRLTKADAEAPMNFQFVLDSLASKDTTSHTPLDLHISSLVIRNTALSYDRLDMPRRTAGFDPNHLSLDKISSHIMLHALTDDSVSVYLKKLSLDEQNSGFSINNVTFDLNAGRHGGRLSNFNLITDHSDISIDASARLDGKTIHDLSLQSKHSSVGLRDMACFVPQLHNISNTVFIDTDIKGNNNLLSLNDLSIHTSNRDFILSINGKAKSQLPLKEAMKDLRSLTWYADVQNIYASSSFVSDVLSAFGQAAPIVARLGSIEYSAKAKGSNGDADLNGTLTTGIGNLTHDVALKDNHLTAHLATNTLKLSYLLGTDDLGDTEINADVSADITRHGQNRSVENANVNITAPLLTAKGYAYRNIKVEASQKNNDIAATIDVADMNINATINAIAGNAKALLDGHPEALHGINVSADISNINPHALGLTSSWPSTTFAVRAEANIANLQNPLQHTELDLYDFTMSSPDDYYHCHHIGVNANEKADGMKDIVLSSDFADMHASGHFDVATLPQSLTNLVAQRLPTLPGIAQFKAQDNEISLSATIDDTAILRKLLNIDIDAERQIALNAFVSDRLHRADISLDAPKMACFGMKLNGTKLHASCPGDTLSLSLSTARLNHDGTEFAVSLDGKAANNNLQTAVTWHNGAGNAFRGALNAQSRLFMNDNGNATATVQILPSEVMISDTLWNLHPSTITYYNNHLSVNGFLVENGHQHVSINGVATKSANDSLVVNMHDINVAYIMNLVNFHDVEFAGFATGDVVAKSLFSEPDAYTNLDVRNFLFENGRLGTLTARGRWDNELGQINIDAQCVDEDVTGEEDGFLKIDGYVNLKNSSIDLGIKATNVRLEFIETYTDSFMDNIHAWANGHVRIYGPLSKINMTGEAIANGSLYIIPLNTSYSLRNAYVKMVPDDIVFMGDTILDKHGNHGIVNGALHHKNLGRMTFDLNIDAKHLLCFDFPELNGSTFCGYAVATGSCKIKGRPGEVNFDIDAYPEETSYITYNASSPDALQNQEFITWRDASSNGVGASDSLSTENDAEKNTFHTNVRLNFMIHATPAASLRLLMDQRTGDYITLNGNGTLRATYYNKGGMQIFGNYLVERGEYKMTIQQVITKNFEFLPGGTIAFGGDPYQAAIDLKAQYVVPSAPLSDLNIGNSFTSSTVRVNCLMNITGTAETPVVEFDLNLPQASSDVQQMITALMDSEEARNQQVLYLLAIGRFYSDTNNADASQSQASLAMQSFLSGTVSQQLNNIISNVIVKNHNWNFGANISPGDEGMMNAEYEGLVSGRMLNNRLLINGQFGYRDNVNATTSFIGDFDVRYLLFPNGNLQVKVYNQTSDRYFTKSNLNTQGLGIILKHDFKSFIPTKWSKIQKKK